MKKLATLFCALAALTACSTKQNDAENAAPTKSQIYVTAAEGKEPEFTQVVR